jgi:lambda repressor-like predicted transcriptional regulator
MSNALEQHERIKMRLRLAGSSLAKIARELGVAATTVTSVSQGYRRSRRIEGAIAAKLGKQAVSLWPERYPNDVEEPEASPSMRWQLTGEGMTRPIHA